MFRSRFWLAKYWAAVYFGLSGTYVPPTSNDFTLGITKASMLNAKATNAKTGVV
jgi:hypothetical protein